MGNETMTEYGFDFEEVFDEWSTFDKLQDAKLSLWLEMTAFGKSFDLERIARFTAVVEQLKIELAIEESK